MSFGCIKKLQLWQYTNSRPTTSQTVSPILGFLNLILEYWMDNYIFIEYSYGIPSKRLSSSFSANKERFDGVGKLVTAEETK